MVEAVLAFFAKWRRFSTIRHWVGIIIRHGWTLWKFFSSPGSRSHQVNSRKRWPSLFPPFLSDSPGEVHYLDCCLVSAVHLWIQVKGSFANKSKACIKSQWLMQLFIIFSYFLVCYFSILCFFPKNLYLLIWKVCHWSIEIENPRQIFNAP